MSMVAASCRLPHRPRDIEVASRRRTRGSSSGRTPSKRIMAIAQGVARLRRTNIAPSIGAVAMAFALAYASGQTLLEAVFLSILFIPLVIGLIGAWRSGRRAVGERARASTARGTTDASAAAAAVADERRRMSTDIESIVHVAVQRIATLADQMAIARATTSATEVEDDKQLQRLRAIQAEGRAAATELRRLLGLLRTAPEQPPTATTTAAAPACLPRRARRLVPSRGDVVLAGLAVVTTLIDAVALGPMGVKIGVIRLSLTAAAAGVVLWRVNPGLGAGIVALLAMTGMVLEHPLTSGLWMVVTPPLLLWGAIARPLRDRLAVLAPIAMVVSVLLSQWLSSRENASITVVILAIAALTGAAFAVGERLAGRAVGEAAEHDLRLSSAAAQAVVESRLAASRELHDSISGSIGVIVTQAGAADLLWTKDTHRAREALTVVRSTAAAALADLATMREGLAPGGEGPSSLRARGLGDLPSLLTRMRQGGLEVTTEVSMETGGVGPEAELTAYRIVQEGLANAMRHAPDAAVHVVVIAEHGELRVSVTDDGPGAGYSRRSGYGLTGLGERVQRLGGTFTAARAEGGRGFGVEAVLPVAPVHLTDPTKQGATW